MRRVSNTQATVRVTSFVLLVLAVVFAGLSTRPTSPAAAPRASDAVAPSNPTTRQLQGTAIVRYAGAFRRGSGYERYPYVIVSRDAARAAAHLPGRVLVYMSGTSVQKGWSTGVEHEEALAAGWLLVDEGGEPLLTRYGASVADVGNPAYQQRFGSNVATFLARTKADGVFIDDVVATPDVLAGTFPTKYPTREAWESAMVSFVRTVGAILRSRGYFVLANANKFVPGDARSDTAALTASFWRRLAGGVSGLMCEYWLQNPNDAAQLRAIGSKWFENWDGWQSLVRVAQRSGVEFFGLMYGTTDDTRAMRLGRGSFLLDWNGRGGAFLYHVGEGDEPSRRVWAQQLGMPIGVKQQRAPGVWQRRFSRGIVVVNATSSPRVVRVNGFPTRVGATDAVFVSLKAR